MLELVGGIGSTVYCLQLLHLVIVRIERCYYDVDAIRRLDPRRHFLSLGDDNLQMKVTFSSKKDKRCPNRCDRVQLLTS